MLLHFACNFDRLGMVRQLTSHPRHGCLNSKSSLGDTAIMRAVKCGEAECVVALGQVAGVELNTRDMEGRSLEELARCGGGW